MLRDETKELKEILANENKGLTFEIRFPNNVTYYIFDLECFIGFFDKEGTGHLIGNRRESYVEMLESCEDKIPYKKTLIRLIKEGIIEEMFNEHKLVCEVKPLGYEKDKE